MGDNFLIWTLWKMLCISVFGCYLTTIQYGLRNGGGIAESLKNISFLKYLEINIEII